MAPRWSPRPSDASRSRRSNEGGLTTATQDLAPEPPRTPGTLVWRGRAFLLFALAGLGVILGLLFASPPALLLAVPLLAAPLSPWLLAPSGRTEATVDGSVEDVDGALEIRWTVGLDPPPSGGVVSLLEEGVPGAEPPEPLTGTCALSPGGSATVPFRVHPWRPLFQRVDPPRIFWRDPLGLAEVEVRVRGEGVLLERYPPELRRLRQVNLRRTTVLPGEVRSQRTGASGDFNTLRPYSPGDGRRTINWWASARRGQWMSNEYLAERSGELLLILDLRTGEPPVPGLEHLLGVGRAACVGIARELLREKTRVGLALFTEFPQVLPLGTGRLQRYRLEQMLSEAKPTSADPPVERLAVNLRRSVPAGTQALLVTPLEDPETLTLGFYLERRGFPTVLLSPSPLRLEQAALDRTHPAGDLAYRLARLARRARLRQAWEYSPVVDWSEFETLAPLVEFLRRPAISSGGRRV